METSIQNVYRWHTKYCERLTAFAFAAGERIVKIETPNLSFNLRATKCAGLYRKTVHSCIYSLPYAVVLGDEFEQTVAHEVCHAFQTQIYIGNDWKWHSDYFKFLLRVVCNFPLAGTYHTWRKQQPAIKRVGEVFALNKSMVRKAVKRYETEMQELGFGLRTFHVRPCTDQTRRQLAGMREGPSDKQSTDRLD